LSANVRFLLLNVSESIAFCLFTEVVVKRGFILYCCLIGFLFKAKSTDSINAGHGCFHPFFIFLKLMSIKNEKNLSFVTILSPNSCQALKNGEHTTQFKIKIE
jgi:hypothetical protein